jgi:hypothetical protein
MLAQWWPIATQNDEDSQSLVRSMLDVFPYVTLWTTELHEMMIIGSMKPVPLDFALVSKRMRTPTIVRALQEVGVMTPAQLEKQQQCKSHKEASPRRRFPRLSKKKSPHASRTCCNTPEPMPWLLSC